MKATIGVTLLLLWLALAGCSRGQPTAYDLKVGDCFDQQGDGLAVLEVAIQPCSESHQFEVFHLADLPDAAYPGELEVVNGADRACNGAFEAYVGRSYDSSELFISYLYPSVGSWAEGDREVICLLHLDGTPLTGSMRQSAR